MLATVAQFVDFVGREEAIQHSQLDNPESEVIDHERIINYLDQAAVLLRQKVPDTWECFTFCQLRVARYLFDPHTTREAVIKGYEEAWRVVDNRPRLIAWT